MKCIILDDEPLGRKAIQLLVEKTPEIKLIGSFGDVSSAGKFMQNNPVDLIFLDIRMPEMDGIEFARTIRQNTLVIFTTAYAEYALNSYEVDAIDYLLKPIELERFQKAIEKAQSYHTLLSTDSQKNSVEVIASEYMFVKSERRYFKILFEDIYFIEGLKDYVVIQTINQRIITKMTLKTIGEQLPGTIFFRISKSYIINTHHIDSFDNNDVFINKYEIPIGNGYRDTFFDEYLLKNKNY